MAPTPALPEAIVGSLRLVFTILAGIKRDRVLRLAGALAIANFALALAEPAFDLDPNAWWWLTLRFMVFLPMVFFGLLWLGCVVRDNSLGGRGSK